VNAPIAYMMSRFPHLPETFILREMSELRRQGWEIALYPLIRQKQAVVHAEARAWLAESRALSWSSRAAVSANLRWLAHYPAQYLRLYGRMVRGNWPSRKFLARSLLLFPEAVLAAQWMVREGICHIHAHYATHPALVAWLVHQLTGISYSVTVHAHDIFVDQTMLEEKLAGAAFVVAISQYNREFLGRVTGDAIQAKTHVIHCGIDPAQYHLRSVFVPAGERLEIVHVGSLQPYKGQIYLVEACELLRQRGVPFVCRIIGGGEERRRLEEAIRRLGLQDQVVLLGPQTQEKVGQLLAGAGCYVQPSVATPSGKMEGIPVALMEALACGLPVVATDLSGIPELIRPGETGWLVPPEDPGALAEAMLDVYANPPEALRRAKAGRQLVLDEFDLRMNVACLSSLFRQVLEDGDAARRVPPTAIH